MQIALHIYAIDISGGEKKWIFAFQKPLEKKMDIFFFFFFFLKSPSFTRKISKKIRMEKKNGYLHSRTSGPLLMEFPPPEKKSDFFDGKKN